MTPAERLAAFVTGWLEHRPNDRGIIARVFGVPVRTLIPLTTGDLQAVLVELGVARVRIADLEAEVAELRDGLDDAVADMHEVITGSRELPPAEDADDEQFDLTDDDEALGDAEAFYAYP